MKAIILSAGSNKGLEEILGDKPKASLDLEGSSLLEVQMNLLYQCGVEEVIVIRGFGREHIDIPGVTYYDNTEYSETNMLYSLMKARDEFNDSLLVIYGDTIFSESTIRRLLSSSADLSLGLVTDTAKAFGYRRSVDLSDLEQVVFNSDNIAVKIGKNLPNEDKNTGVFCGLLKCSKYGAELLIKNYDRIISAHGVLKFRNNHNQYEAFLCDLLYDMAEYGVPLHCTAINSEWMELNSLEDYEQLLSKRDFLQQLITIKTDWADRSETYNNIDWVNRGDTVSAMMAMTDGFDVQVALDLGTGTGKIINAVYKTFPDAKCYGIDISLDMMSKMENKDKFDLREAFAEDLSCFEDNTFDLITARMVFHHISNLDKACKEIYRILKPGGRLIVCEGTPPDRKSVSFYEEMFRYKEDRKTFLMDDLSNLLYKNGFSNIMVKAVFSANMSLNNWINNAGVPFRNRDIIRKMHFECEQHVKDAYNMRVIEDDIIMDWKFAVVCGEK
jgi:ubiquinone/menaquinone biosynthesis C-methylase UbiE/choline kinase